MNAVTATRWIDRSPRAYLYRAVNALFADVPQWIRWGFVWVALIGAMMIACYALMFVLSWMLGMS